MSMRAHPVHRPRLLIVAHACHPGESMETRVGWKRAIAAAAEYDVTVLHSAAHSVDELTQLAVASGVDTRWLKFVAIETATLRWLRNWGSLYWAGCRKWESAAYRVAQRLHAEQPFDLVHKVTYCGYREPGRWWRLGPPLVWGPVGGTQNFPTQFCSLVDFFSGVREVTRNWLNTRQLRGDRRVHAALRHAAAVLAATSTGQRDLERAAGIRCQRLLETGVELPVDDAPRTLDCTRPLRIVWSGRLREWKALPLLLRALALLPADVAYQVRVLGVGSSQRRWQQMAAKLGLADRVEWVGWPAYEETLDHYRWADVFAFTSLRDTSGTGLLESLAAGTPIIGLDHQGAHDIMTPACAMPIAVSDPDQTIQAFATAIVNIAADPSAWQQLSQGARARARQFTWDRLSAQVHGVYHEVLRTAAAGALALTVPDPTAVALVGSAAHS